MDNVEREQYMGCSKFDKLRRISVIKPVSDRMGLREGDEVSFYIRGSEVIIRKRIVQDIDQDMIIQDVLNQLRYNMTISISETGEPIITSQLGEYYDSSKIHLLDEEHYKKLLNDVGVEVARIIGNYQRTHKKDSE